MVLFVCANYTHGVVALTRYYISLLCIPPGLYSRIILVMTVGAFLLLNVSRICVDWIVVIRLRILDFPVASHAEQLFRRGTAARVIMILLTVLHRMMPIGHSKSPGLTHVASFVFNMLIVLMIPAAFVSMVAFYVYTTRALWGAGLTAMTEAKEAKSKADEVAAQWLKHTAITQAISVLTAMLGDISFLLYSFGHLLCLF